MVNELLYHAVKVVVSFFIGIMALFCLVTSFRAWQKTSGNLFERSIETSGLGNVNFLSLVILSVFMFFLFYYKVPHVIVRLYDIQKDFNKTPIEVIFKKKLVAVCMVIAGISVPIFFTAVSKYGIVLF